MILLYAVTGFLAISLFLIVTYLVGRLINKLDAPKKMGLIEESNKDWFEHLAMGLAAELIIVLFFVICSTFGYALLGGLL